MLKFKINVNLPRLLCIVVSAALNGEFERFGGLCVNCYYMTCYYVILSTLSVRKFLICRSSFRPYPFENFNKPFIRSTSSVRKIQEAVYPFDLIRSKILISRSSIYGTRFERLA